MESSVACPIFLHWKFNFKIRCVIIVLSVESGFPLFVYQKLHNICGVFHEHLILVWQKCSYESNVSEPNTYTSTVSQNAIIMRKLVDILFVVSVLERSLMHGPYWVQKKWKPHDTLPVCIITPFKIKQTISLWVRVVGGTMCEWDRWGKHMVNCNLIYFSLHPFLLEITSGQIHSPKVRLTCSK